MADTVTTQILQDGPRNAVLKLTNVSDGTGEAGVTKVNVTTLEGSPSRVSIERVIYATNGMGVRIAWDAGVDSHILTIPADDAGKMCFRDFGGLPNDESVGATGNINFTTVGHTAGDSYSIILVLKKN